VPGTVGRAPFGSLPDGTPVERFSLSNAQGAELVAMELGATILSIRVPDRQGRLDDVVLGFDDLGGYLAQPHYVGAVIGRTANRIRGGRFTLDGRAYRLLANDGPHHLHGGPRGFDKAVWRGRSFLGDDGPGIAFAHTSPPGDQGYPGRVEVEVRLGLTERSEVVIEYFASTDAPTPIALTHHEYFNLAGRAARDVLGHQLWIDADGYTPLDAERIPTGAIEPVVGTALDFHSLVTLGSRIGGEDPAASNGFDHNFVLRRTGLGLAHAATLVDPLSGRRLEVRTTEPGVQLFTGNDFDGTLHGRGGRRYHRYAGLSLETQHFPDAPNHRHFPSTILRPGQRLESRTVYAFSVFA